MKISYIIPFLFLFVNGFAQTQFAKYNDEGYYFYQQNDMENAIKKFSKALDFKDQATNTYKVADTYINRGACKQVLQKYNSALDDYDEALKLKPEYIRAHQLKTECYLVNNKYQQAINCADKGLEIKPTDALLKGRKAEGLNKLKKYDQAIVVLHSILDENPRSKNALKCIGHNYQLKKNWDSALKYFSSAIILDPLDYASFFDRGIAYAENKDTVKALKDIRQAMRLDSNQRWIGLNNIAYFVKLRQNDFKGAITMFDRAIQLNPKFPYAYSNRGFAKLNLGDVKGAYEDLKISLNLDNTNSYAYKNLALINLKDGKKSDACNNLKKALELGYTSQYDDDAQHLLDDNCK